ncbi:MAG: hypothetical protein K8R69_00100 [Deltaproteobacteria bacterium]|nr:hypothetical protein [Deltaproteobacteria bacterium]
MLNIATIKKLFSALDAELAKMSVVALPSSSLGSKRELYTGDEMHLRSI